LTCCENRFTGLIGLNAVKKFHSLLYKELCLGIDGGIDREIYGEIDRGIDGGIDEGIDEGTDAGTDGGIGGRIEGEMAPPSEHLDRNFSVKHTECNFDLCSNLYLTLTFLCGFFVSYFHMVP
jgi:hypothetical protein